MTVGLHSSSSSLLAENISYCIFRTGLTWQAFPAADVREVMPRPQLVCVPHSPLAFAGLCHVRSEFVPVVNLKRMLNESDMQDEQVLLILEDTDGPWGVLVDEVIALQRLEVSDAPESFEEDHSSLVVGWGIHDDAVIQILDHRRLRRLAEGYAEAG